MVGKMNEYRVIWWVLYALALQLSLGLAGCGEEGIQLDGTKTLSEASPSERAMLCDELNAMVSAITDEEWCKMVVNHGAAEMADFASMCEFSFNVCMSVLPEMSINCNPDAKVSPGCSLTINDVLTCHEENIQLVKNTVSGWSCDAGQAIPIDVALESCERKIATCSP
jgi:hypothetical protein